MKHLFSFILCFLFSNCFSQNNFQNYTTKDGLPSNQVYDIYQDKHGIIWFATDRGLSSFNGSFFNNFTTLDGLLSDVIFDFFPQKDGTVWCSTEKGKLFIFDPIHLNFTPFKFNNRLPELYNKGRELKSLLIDNGQYYLRFTGMTGYIKISSSGKMEEFEFSRLQLYVSSKYYLKHLKKGFYYYSYDTSDAINRTVLPGANRDMIVNNNNGKNVARIGYEYLYLIDQNKNVNTVKLIDKGELLQVGSVGDLFWVTGYNMGLKLINSKGEIIKSFLNGLPCSNYLKDKDDGVWISTISNGVYYFPSTQVKLLKFENNKYITSLSVSNYCLAVGTHDASVVQYSLVDGKAKFDFAGTKGIVRFHDGKLFSNIVNQRSEVFSAFVRRFSENQHRELITIVSRSIYIDQKHCVFKSSEEVYDAEFINNNIVLSQGKCIKIINSKNDVIDSLNLQSKTIDLDVVNGKIYCATNTKGLLVLDENLRIINSIDIKSGLKSNCINELKIHNGNVWLGTRNGFSRINNFGKKNQQISTISIYNGLSDQEITDFDFFGDTVFLGTRQGINYFLLKNWDDIVHSKTSIFFSIKEIRQQGKEISTTEDMTYYQNDLSIEVELAAFHVNKDILFRYKMEGLDKDWIVTRSRMINFKSLPPGTYELMIQVKVNDHWNEKVLRQKIQIHPAWYTTWWFIVLSIVFIVLIIWLFFKYRILNYNREIIREILRQALKRIKSKENVFIVRSNGRDVKITSKDVLYVESSRNYLTIYTTNKKIVIREKISNFLELIPDPIEYIQIKRSIIVRIDQITSKSKDSVIVDNQEIKVGVTYMDNLKKIQF